MTSFGEFCGEFPKQENYSKVENRKSYESVKTSNSPQSSLQNSPIADNSCSTFCLFHYVE